VLIGRGVVAVAYILIAGVTNDMVRGDLAKHIIITRDAAHFLFLGVIATPISSVGETLRTDERVK